MNCQLIIDMESIRWAFRVGAWTSTKEQWSAAIRCVQQEEKDRINRFVFQKDAKSALAGRLLMRRVINHELKIPYKDIVLARTEKGKPYLVSHLPESLNSYNFNVSHQGEYAVLAAEPVHQVGVDVMQTERPRGKKSIPDFFKTMDRQFTAHEWDIIKEPVQEWDQLKNFYRFWCLKESYVKAVGVGIGFSLQRLDFCPKSDLEQGTIDCGTQVYVDDTLAKDWMFEETLLDKDHSTAVALHKVEQSVPLPNVGSKFQELTIDELMEGSLPITEYDPNDWKLFSSKQAKPQLK